jgi:predicted small integral membrane protein
MLQKITDWFAQTFAWMAWTWQTALLFAALFSILTVMTLLAVYRPEFERAGVLRIGTTRGDRLFLSILGAAIVHIVWIAIAGIAALWGATILAAVLAVVIFLYV